MRPSVLGGCGPWMVQACQMELDGGWGRGEEEIQHSVKVSDSFPSLADQRREDVNFWAICG
jgi:hypothetical protein